MKMLFESFWLPDTKVLIRDMKARDIGHVKYIISMF